MIFDPGQHHRRSIRLPEYNYAGPGEYFLTLCTFHRFCLFGRVIDGAMHCNEYGRIVERCLQEVCVRYPHVTWDTYVIMPNHLHAILFVRAGGPRPYGERGEQYGFHDGRVEATNAAPTLGNIVAYFKYESTKTVNRLRAAGAKPVWQRNYYEHIIHDDESLDSIREYILNNPSCWEQDHENPERKNA